MLTLRWERVDMDALTFRVEETKTGVPLELPITSQLAAILERRRDAAGDLPVGIRDWVFPSPTIATGHVQASHHLCGRVSKAWLYLYQPNRVIPDVMVSVFHGVAHSRLVIWMISSALWLKVSQTSVTAFLTCSALSNTRLAKRRCLRTEKSVSAGFGSGLYGGNRSSETFAGMSRSFDRCQPA
ncbi:MAG: hypothetical protein OXC93_07275, partial [Rhodospirillaceae bacterium]|nr:hypothetical protein [Rhodospirillaceae bacterium]